jgi:hypothetical protein
LSIRGVGVIDAMPLDEISLDSRYRTLVALVGEELEVGRDYGLSRVVARLGRAGVGVADHVGRDRTP